MTQIQPTALVPASTSATAPTAESAIGALFDVINPLQHIPFVSTLYRAMTGDTISDGAKLVGDGLFGGIGGLISSAADIAFETATGKSVGDTILDGAEDIANSVGVPPSIPGVTATSLQADGGESLATVNLAEMAGIDTSKSAEPVSFALDRKALGLAPDASLGLTNSYKKTQLLSELDDVTLKLQS